MWWASWGKLNLVLGILLLTLFSSTTWGQGSSSSERPKKPRLSIGRLRPKSVIIHSNSAEVPQDGVTVPCIVHVVKVQVPPESTWVFAPEKFDLQELPNRGFELRGLEPDKMYNVQAACKASPKHGSSVGDFSLPLSFYTPLTDKKDGSGGTGGGGGGVNGDDEDGNGSENGGSSGDGQPGSPGGKAGNNPVKLSIFGISESDDLRIRRNLNLTPNLSLKDSSIEEAMEGTHRIWGALGHWVNMTCPEVMDNDDNEDSSSDDDDALTLTIISNSNGDPPSTSTQWSHKGRPLVQGYGVEILSLGNVSVLKVLLKTSEEFGLYACRYLNPLPFEIHGSNKSPLAFSTKRFLVGRAKEPPPFNLTLGWVQTTSAKFHIVLVPSQGSGPGGGSDQEDKEDKGIDLPISNVYVEQRAACCVTSEWIKSNLTLHDDGFTIKDLHPKEWYYIRVALVNDVAVGRFQKYWKIRTSYGVELKSKSRGHRRIEISWGILTMAMILSLTFGNYRI